MNEKVLTVVVPSYNVEAYLADTLKSFIHPDIMEEVEVLIVNDESTDSTEEIGRSFEVRYPQTFRVITKKNGGHGSTINRGIQEGQARTQGGETKTAGGENAVMTNARQRASQTATPR